MISSLKKLLIISINLILCSTLVNAEVSSVAENDNPETSESSYIFMPDQDIFKPLIAAPRESLFSIRNERYKTEDDKYKAAVVSFGDYLPVVNYSFGEEQVLQFNIDGALYALFNLDTPSYDLINTDYIFGLSLSHEMTKNIASRLRLYHGSSHLGDEFILDNPDFKRTNSSFEDMEYLLSYHTDAFRVYGGGGVIFRSNNEIKNDPLSLKTGAEYRYPLPGYTMTDILAATHIDSHDRGNWRLSHSIMLGLSILRSETREIRLMANYFNGSSPQGQFYEERLRYYGLGIYFVV